MLSLLIGWTSESAGGSWEEVSGHLCFILVKRPN